MYLTADTTETTVNWEEDDDPGAGFTAYYDAVNGTLMTGKPTTGYGKGTSTEGSAANTQFNYDPKTSYVNEVIKVTVDGSGNCTFAWEVL